MTIRTNPIQTLVRVKKNLEAIGATLKDNTGVAIDLTGSTVSFRLVEQATGSVKIDNASANIDDAVAGKVSYQPSGTDFDTPGKYAAYFIINSSPAQLLPYDGARFIIRVVEEARR